MSQMVNVNFKLNEDVKKSMEKTCSELGMSMSTEISVDPFYSKSNIRYLEKIAEDIKNGQAHFSEHELIEEE